jgi:hypothetical protein
MKYTCIIKDNSLTVKVGGKMQTILNTHPNFEKIVKAVKKGKSEEKLLALIDMTKAVQDYVSDKIKISNGVLYYEDKPLHNTLTEKIIHMMDDGFDITAMLNFLANLRDNPSRNSQEMLYTFLENNDLPITPSGMIVTYKAVDKNFKDYHTHTFDNSVGKTLQMPRCDVDDVAERHCSSGFHVADFSYAKSFMGYEGHLILCEVNPKNVVAVTNDSSFRKMRVCEYTVIAEVTENGDVLKGKSVHMG